MKRKRFDVGRFGRLRIARAAVRRTTRPMVDILFPPLCLACHRWTGPAAGFFCPSCLDGLNSERGEPACPRCAEVVGPYGVTDGRCGRCRDRRLRVDQTIRVGPYRNALGALTRLGKLLRAFKYHGRSELGETLGSWLAEAVEAASWRDRIEAVVTVPTHWKHRLVRPSYAAELLASVVTRATALPETRLLRRVRAGPHQIGLSYTARRKNVRGAFAVRRGVKLHQARLLLVDDVKTTGATLEECARILRAAGAAEVYAAVAVKVPWKAPTGQAIRSI